jgi:hypothetical protein
LPEYVSGVGVGTKTDRDAGNGLVVISEIEPSTTMAFGFTGEPQTVTFPADATTATIRVWGAGGAGRQGYSYNNYNGGSGGYAETTVDLIPG